MAHQDFNSMLENRLFHIGVVVLTTCLCYLPGLNSPFLFDDGPNLDALVHIKGLSIFSSGFWEFVLGGEAGPTGRPVSLFTFALQAAAWPDNPAAIKSINLLIHCLNALLVYGISTILAMVLLKKEKWQQQEKYHRISLIAVTATLVWSLHPALTSTVLYAVQRMALLSNFFMLLGIYCHLLIRIRPIANPRRQLLYLTISLAGNSLLALLAKENAPSLVFYLLTLEFTLLNTLPAQRPFLLWRRVCLLVPAILILLLPMVFISQLQDSYTANFTFTLVQRLLTQFRILWDYLSILLLPTTAAIGIFHDVPVSTSLTSPMTTLAALVGWIVLFGIVIARPDRYKAGLFALCWYWSGHLIESTVMPLEMFFHHRNYLAYFGIMFAMVFGFLAWLPATVMRHRMRIAVASLYLGLLAFNTFRISSLWAEPLQLAEHWYEAEPGNVRNAEFYATQLVRLGSDGEVLAAAVLAQAVDNDQASYHLLLNLATLGCVNPAITPPTRDQLLQMADTLTVEDRALVAPVQQIITLHLQGNCEAYSTEFLSTLLNTLISRANRHDKGMYQYDLFRLYSVQGEDKRALELLAAAYDNARDAGILFNYAIALINAEEYTQAMENIDTAIANITADNNIRTGTRETKLALLYSMREDVLGFMAQVQ